MWPSRSPQKRKRERCLRLGFPETGSETKMYVQGVHEGVFSGTPVRKWGKQAWIEGEVASEASADHPGSSGVGLTLQSCPQ